jgi:regulator of CtrA degradation
LQLAAFRYGTPLIWLALTTADRLSAALTRYYAVLMLALPNLNPRLVEALYIEALTLADEVRERFDGLRRTQAGQTADESMRWRTPEAELARVQANCEALRTTTRVMHCLAWLLNHRAYFAGELNEVQLRRHGRMIANFPLSDPTSFVALPADAQLLVRESERLYERIQRLDHAWRGAPEPPMPAIKRLRERLQQRLLDYPNERLSLSAG